MSFYIPHDRVGLDTGDETVVQQSFKDECDINNILAQYKQTGIISHINAAAASGRYMDLPTDVDLQSSFAIVAQATDAFSSLPATVRDRFNNDPSAFLAAFTDASLADELRELGLLNPAPVAPPVAE